MITEWEHKRRLSRGISVNYIDAFNARGMRRVYGRCDYFGRGRTFNMDVWLTKDGRLLARFWARRDEVDCYSLEVIGHTLPIVQNNRNYEANEEWVPQCLRVDYDNWVMSEFGYS